MTYQRTLTALVLGVFLSIGVLVPATASAYTDIVANPPRCAAPCTITFTAKTQGATGQVHYEWDLRRRSQDSPGSFNPEPQYSGMNPVQKTYDTPGWYVAQVQARDDVHTEGGGKEVVIIDPADRPAPIGFLGPQSFTTPATLKFTSPKTHLTVTWSQGFHQGDVTGVPNGQDGAGNTIYDIAIPAAPTGDIQLDATAWTVSSSNADQQSFTATVTGSTGPVWFDFKSSLIARSYQPSRAVVGCQFSANLSLVGTQPYRYSGFVRLQYRYRDRKGRRTRGPWRTLTGPVRVSADSRGSFGTRTWQTLLFVRSSPSLTRRMRLPSVQFRIDGYQRIYGGGRVVNPNPTFSRMTDLSC